MCYSLVACWYIIKGWACVAHSGGCYYLKRELSAGFLKKEKKIQTTLIFAFYYSISWLFLIILFFFFFSLGKVHPELSFGSTFPCLCCCARGCSAAEVEWELLRCCCTCCFLCIQFTCYLCCLRGSDSEVIMTSWLEGH